ncbi:MAG: S8 family serine peptidase [Allosphingosinicella sp.]
MRKLAIMAISALPLVALAQPVQAQVAGEKIAGSYICVFKPGAVSRGNAQAEANRAVQGTGGQVSHVYSVAIKGFAANLPAQALERVQANNPNIAYCEQDQVVSIPPVKLNGKPSDGVVAMAQETPWGIARVNGGGAGNFATAWVLDSGIQMNHPDLRVDSTRSRSFLGRNTTPTDQHGHGTHVAGTIAALDNGTGVIGVAPGALLVSVRVLDRRGSGTTSGVIAGVDYVAQYGQPGDVANMSLGGGVSASLDTAVANAAAGGVRFTLAAGNEGTHANNSSPGRVNGANIYTVSAFGVGDVWASFSNYGNPPVDYAEPGVSVKSTYLNGGYATMSGTSMAAPHLAGLLLAGPVQNGGTVQGDPDGNPDVIGVH